MKWQLGPSYSDYFVQLSSLLRAPVYRNPPNQLGNGEPILLIPGFLAGDWTLRVMAGWLNRLGYRTYLSGIDWNIDCPNRTGELLRWRLDHIIKETGQPITAIGHSLGGMLARFLGTRYSGKVSSVISVGSPIHLPVTVNPLVLFTSHALYPLRRLRGNVPPECGSLECQCQFQQSVFSPLPSHITCTSVFSKEDEVVAWHSSIDPASQNLEVSGRHLGLIVNRQVYQALLEVLSAGLSSEGLDQSAPAEVQLSENGQPIHKTGTEEDAEVSQTAPPAL
jgi:triacylglycerol lipase